jgi:hypothetical protein
VYSGTLAQFSDPSPDRQNQSGMKVVAQFDPPEAQSRFAKWRDEHLAVLSTIPDDAWRIDTGRADGGHFVRVRVEESYAERFG